MQYNVGKTDRTIRIVAGIVIILAGLLFRSWWGAIGLIPLITGLSRRCLLYIPFGISTLKEEEKEE